VARTHYTLTRRAEKDLAELADWSLARWGGELTNAYLDQLHRGIEWVAKNQQKVAARPDLAADTHLSVYPLREHYVVFIPVGGEHIIILSFLRQGRDVATILRKNSARLTRELKNIMQKINSREIVLPAEKKL